VAKLAGRGVALLANAAQPARPARKSSLLQQFFREEPKGCTTGKGRVEEIVAPAWKRGLRRRGEMEFDMTRHATRFGVVALTAALVVPSVSQAFFPPNVGQPPVVVKSVPPDPFGVPTTGGLGEPTPPDPGKGPAVQTPEPATIVIGLTGLAMAGAFGLRKRLQAPVA
jgi:hypothetical protein